MSERRKYGYARVSTKYQNEDRQLIALADCGVLPEHIYVDKQSGKDFNRRKYNKLLKVLKRGDVLFVHSIDRLGRNYGEIQEHWRKITREIRADIVVLDMPLLDTRKREKNLTDTFIADLVLQILSYVAETERAYSKQRQAEGIAAAKAKGIKFGRPSRIRPKKFVDLYEAWTRQEVSARGAAKELGITHRAFILWAKQEAIKVE